MEKGENFTVLREEKIMLVKERTFLLFEYKGRPVKHTWPSVSGTFKT